MPQTGGKGRECREVLFVEWYKEVGPNIQQVGVFNSTRCIYNIIAESVDTKATAS